MFILILGFTLPSGKSPFKFFWHFFITVSADRFEIDFNKFVPFRLSKEGMEERTRKNQDTSKVERILQKNRNKKKVVNILVGKDILVIFHGLYYYESLKSAFHHGVQV